MENKCAKLLSRACSASIRRYLELTPRAKQAMELLGATGLRADHLALRTFSSESMQKQLEAFQCKPQGTLQFPAKHLHATWLSCPQSNMKEDGNLDVTEQLPMRIFLSSIDISKLSPTVQSIVMPRAESAAKLPADHALLCFTLGELPWDPPTVQEYEMVCQESEYAAWVMVHGYAVNHVAIAVHRLPKQRSLEEVNELLEEHGIPLNIAGGKIKTSNDGLLLQTAAMADQSIYEFADGASHVAGSYIEFAERKILPEYKYLKSKETEECHRRDGFEVGNADRIFESTNITAD
mmetsp:Transcript_5244/g.32992  ORF Transcript_5244/g.32992 Transcript_5244/m.32992 type:complete len:293 (-) Transcript_5244:2101-2979(-)